MYMCIKPTFVDWKDLLGLEEQSVSFEYWTIAAISSKIKVFQVAS